MQVRPELEDPALVVAFEGWNDAGEAATTALEFVSRSVASVPLGDIDPDDYFDFTVRRPRVSYDRGETRRIEWPSNAFRYGHDESAGAIITCHGVEPHLRWRRFCETICELALDLGVRRAVLLGAYLADVVYSQPVVVSGFSSDRQHLDMLDVEPSGYSGPTGVVGVLADALQAEGISVLSLWAGLPHYIDASPNPRGALALARRTGSYLGLTMDLEPLATAAQEFEERVSKVVADDEELANYVKELKRREFAQ